MTNNEFIPASLRIGGAPTNPPHKPSLNVLLRSVETRYANYLDDQLAWDRSDTRDLIISMKIALERMQQQRDEARQEVCRNNHQQGGVPPHHYAESRGWDCFYDKDEADTNNTLFRTTDGE